MNKYDFIAVGAGPSNLSLVSQAYENTHINDRNFLILEKKNEVCWHPGMLLPGSRLDTHFAKDLITMINPKSEFTFLNFLLEQNRLEGFLNCGTPHPYRVEFDRYLRWCASKISKHLRTGYDVTRIEKKQGNGYAVHCRLADGSQSELITDNVVLGMGGQPKMICDLTGNESRVIHSDAFIQKIAKIKKFNRDQKILVVGAGQSSGELIRYLLNSTLNNIDIVLSDYALTAKEGTAFINESYNGEFIDRFYNMTPEMKSWFCEKRRNMNYGVVDEKVIDGLYNEYYFAKNFDERKVNFLSFCKVEDISLDNDSVNVQLKNREYGNIFEKSYDYVVLATGYSFSQNKEILSHLIHSNVLDVERDYSVKGITTPSGGSIFLNGNVSQSHGPAEDVLSVISHRSRDILESIYKPSKN